MGLLKSDYSSNNSSQDSEDQHSGGFNAVLDRGSEFEGKLTFEGTVRIDGKFKGEIFSSARLVVGETGQVDANMKVDSISVSGRVTGDIVAKNKVELHSTAVVTGNITAPKLVVEEGAVIEGGISMNAMESASAGKKPSVGMSVDDKKSKSDLQA